MKKHLPQNCHATRVENLAVAGVPDVHVASHGAMFWIELKTTKDNALNIRQAQIAWHMGYFGAGGVAFFLVARAKQGDLFLFHGRDALKLASNGLHNMEQSAVYHGTSLQACVDCVLRLAGVYREA